GVLLVGATNRPDIVDSAIYGRRLTPIEVGLPDASGRRTLLDVLLRHVKLAADVDLDELAESSERLSGADLKRIRDQAGMKALGRVARASDGAEAAVEMDDLRTALDAVRSRASLVEA
ncbi:MAG: AAA family ATPase, partial [Actinomycetota bacterium]